MRNRKLVNLITFFLVIISFHSCTNEKKEWTFDREIALEDIAPIGMAIDETAIWISDGDNNRLIKTDLNGNIIDKVEGFNRPMHLDAEMGKIYIPEYVTDSIVVISDVGKYYLEIEEELDAPAGIDVSGNNVAIADFYNHRIILKSNDDLISIGKKGMKADGDLHYPTDVQIVEQELYVADAYNHRIQVFTLEGKHLRTFGSEQKMNAATGLFVERDIVYVTDFENDRVLLFHKDGRLIQTIDGHLSKPTDIIINDNELWVANYKSNNISVFRYDKVIVDKSKMEYTSAYICPMHCEGSGSESPGKCPVCGMNYKLKEETN